MAFQAAFQNTTKMLELPETYPLLRLQRNGGEDRLMTSTKIVAY